MRWWHNNIVVYGGRLVLVVLRLRRNWVNKFACGFLLASPVSLARV